jgi:uncharacterized protein
MPQQLFPLFVPSSLRALAALERMLGHVAQSAEPGTLLQRRLVPDMFPLHRQIDIVLTAVNGSATRLSEGIEADDVTPELSVFNRGFEHEFASTPPDLDALREGVRWARRRVEALQPGQLVASTARLCIAKPGEQRWFATTERFLVDYYLPNLYFHVSIAYAILRAAGVDLGKGDYMGHDAYEVQHARSERAEP